MSYLKFIISISLLGLCAAITDLELFNKFKIDNNKTYATKEEEKLRYNIFTTNWQKIQEHNKKYDAGKVSWVEGINLFSDLTREEYKTRYLTALIPSNFTTHTLSDDLSVLRVLPKSSANIPQSIDWRTRGYVTPVKNQGACSACWAFSVIGAIESAYAKAHSKLKTFSEQALIDCERKTSQGCKIGYTAAAFAYTLDHGVVRDNKYSYKALQAPTCKQKGNPYVRIREVKLVPVDNENALKEIVGTVGPVSVTMNMEILQSYRSGIVDNRNCPGPGNTSVKSTFHAMLVVGYGNEKGKDFWIIKDSHGTSFGENGYIRVAMGYNICGIASCAYYPILQN